MTKEQILARSETMSEEEIEEMIFSIDMIDVWSDEDSDDYTYWNEALRIKREKKEQQHA